MPGGRPQRRWPYVTGAVLRRKRVVKVEDEAQQGLRRLTSAARRLRLSRWQARAIVTALSLLTLAMGARLTYRSPWLTVQEVRVTGTSQVSADQVRTAAGLGGDSVFRADLDGAEERVANLPRVRSATVSFRGRNQIEVAVEERRPWGSWDVAGVKVPVDVDGFVLDGEAAFYGAPTIVQVEAGAVPRPGERPDAEAVQLAVRLADESQQRFGRQVMQLLYKRGTGLTAVLSGGTQEERPIWVTFGDVRDYDYKLAALWGLLERAREDEVQLNTVDMRFGDRLSFN